jgi:hypothetical protein
MTRAISTNGKAAAERRSAAAHNQINQQPQSYR